ncbi:MAG: TolC family protein [Lacipirellulaceae bacterium]
MDHATRIERRPLRFGAMALRLALATTVVSPAGCKLARPDYTFYDSAAADVCFDGAPSGPTQLLVEEPASCEETTAEAPVALDPNAPVEYREVSLEESIQTALAYSKVMRDLGAVISTPSGLQRTVYDPALAYTDPRFGEEAALSAFDSTFAARAFFDKNDREFNNGFIGTDGRLVQDLGAVNFELRKQAATGTQMAVRHLLDSDVNNNVGNRLGSSDFQTVLEGELRQPLLQGAGLTFNRVAGPNGQPGALNGVLLARSRTDISLAEFEVGVRDLVANVENAYWDLYFAYRDLDAKKRARDYALETYQSVAVEKAEGREKGKAANLGQALEQYWRYESEVVNAQTGRTLDGTRTNNGSIGGTGSTPVGVQIAERRLRLLLGMPINGGPLLRPADQPVVAPIDFDWDLLVNQAIASRPELRRQRWRVKQLELELIASKNFLLPTLDMVGRYRWRGYGEDLASQSSQQFSSAYGELAGGNYQEWQLGVEFEVPLGLRRGHTAVRNAEHALARERVVLHEAKRDVVFGLSNATSDVRRAFDVLKAQSNRYNAALGQIDALKQDEILGNVAIDLVLDAQRRLLDTEILYHQAVIDYTLALRNVHLESGQLLQCNNIQLTEGKSPADAYRDAMDRDARRGKPMSYVSRDLTIARGPVEALPLGSDQSGLTTTLPLESVETSAPELPPVQ